MQTSGWSSLLAFAALTGAALAAAVTAAEPEEKTADAAWFEDRTAAAGVDHPHHTRTFENPYAHVMQGYTALGASAAAADYDGDGFEDVFFTDSSKDGRNRLYRNDGDFTFTDVAAEAGVAEGNDAANASADSLWLDYDDDGDPDLLVVRFGHNQLFENRGGATANRVSSTSPRPPASSATSTASPPSPSTTTSTATSTCSTATTSSR